MIASFSNISDWDTSGQAAVKTFAIAPAALPQTHFKFYRLCIQTVGQTFTGVGASEAVAEFAELQLFGNIPPLVTFDTSNCTFNNANVGINNSIPQYPLDVSGDARVVGNVLLGNTSNSPGYISAANLDYRNRIINGDMRIDQRNNGANVSLGTGNVNRYVTDRWQIEKNTATATLAASQSNINFAVDGFQFALRTSITASQASYGTGEYMCLAQQTIEGVHMTDFQWGTSNAKPATVSFWFYSTVAGTYYLAIRNSSANMSYVYPFTVSATTWSFINHTIPGPTSGTFLSNTSACISMGIFAGTSSSFANASANQAWFADNEVATSAANQGFISTLNATSMVTGFQFEKGPVATPFEYRSLTNETFLCQRYCRPFGAGLYTRFYTASDFEAALQIIPPMRSNPSYTLFGTPSLGTLTGTSADFSYTACNLSLFRSRTTGAYINVALSNASHATSSSSVVFTYSDIGVLTCEF
jgi:hypothetical protein